MALRLSSNIVGEMRQKVATAVRSLRLRDRLLLVTDGAGWVLDGVGENLRLNLPSELKSTLVTGEWQVVRDCTVHFINRAWAWSDGMLDTVHASNRLIGIWWHGRLDSPHPSIQAALERARQLHPRFARMQVSCSSGRQTVLELGVPEEKIVSLPLGLSLRRFRPTLSTADRERMRNGVGARSDSIVIGCFQKDGDGWGDGMEPKLIKGPDLLADALVRLNQRYPIYVVIPGPARGYLKQRIAQAGVPHYAPGFVSADSFPQLYHALDIYISPSRDEGGPAGVLESMASGVPVVSTRAGMPADMIDNGVNGFLVDVEDVDGLTQSAAELIERPDLRHRFANAALQTIQPYDWPVLARRYVDELYRPVMDGGS